ncbi:two-component system, sensor histidine kinase YesM [Gracilibacillus orientalis]|uniref:Two-component system, sensor histidine kinase YesM n=1 Tax=Gracilibacillus orientalis TaxID=334253 RepID=A0A1I4HWI3_9BACI|nr:sensor histidine kinase [Gracilibacillus orientalis]SFL45776.1 two-component system, sensor histidine kinase YesM [Gracilibacillus orientalis]
MQLIQYIKNSLKWKSVIIFLLLVTIPSGLIGSIVIYQSNNILKEQVINTTYRNLNNMESQLNNVIEEIEEISRYMIYSNEFRDFMTYPAVTGEDYNHLNQIRSNLNGFFVFHQSEKDYFHSVQIEGQNQQVLSVGEIVEGEEEKWVNKAMEMEGEILWSTPYKMHNQPTNEDEKVITFYRVINHLYDIKQPIGLVRIRLDQQALYQHVTAGFTNEQHQAFFVHNQEQDITGSDEAKDFSYQTFMDNIHSEGESFQLESDGDVYYGVSRYIEQIDMHLVSVVSEKYVLSEMKDTQSTFGYMILIAVFMGLMTFAGFVFFVVRPILELTRETKRLELGDFKARVKIRSKDEVGQLGYRFNSMVEQIQRLIDSKYKLEIQHKHSELKALQSQINPHFLYNTLDMIRWTARLEHAPETSKSIEDLSTLFRITLSQGKVWIPLKDEIKYVQSYMELQKKRLGETFQYAIFMEAGLSKSVVLKLMLEPLVENSFKHGFQQLQEKKQITIRCYLKGEIIIIDVLDNGIGMDIDRVKQLLHSTEEQDSYALKNVHDRITNAFGNHYGLKIIDVKEGACVRVYLPWIKDELMLNRLIEGDERPNDVKDVDR